MSKKRQGKLSHHTSNRQFLFIFSLIALETVRGGSTDMLYALITSIQVYFLQSLEPHHDSIILNVLHKDLTQCRSVENGRLLSQDVGT